MVKILRALLCALLAVVALVAATPRASAAPPTAAYAGSAIGDVANVSLNVAAINVAGARLANSEATTANPPPSAVSTSRNLAATVGGFGATVATKQLTAPPSAGPVTAPLVAASALGISSGVLTSTNEVDVDGAGNCATDGPAAQTTTTTAGLDVTPTGLVGLGNVLTTEVSSVTTTTGLVSTGGLNRRVESEAVGTLSGVSLFDGAITIGVAGDATLNAYADGTDGGAVVDYDASVVTVTFGGDDTVLELDAVESTMVELGALGRVTVTLNEPTAVVEGVDGLTASASVSVLTLEVELGPDATPLGTATIDLLPLSVSATSPAGGIDCPPPAPTVTAPADGAVIRDNTPTYRGTGVPGATIELTVDGTVVADSIVVDDGGVWTFTQPGPGLTDGEHTVSATQSVSDVASEPSDENVFLVDSEAPAAPQITAPEDGATLNDNTPTVTGTGEPGATVTVEVDGEEVGEVIVSGDGTWELPLTEPLNEGEHTITATQTDEAGNTSAADEVTVTVDTQAAPPVITNPKDGSATNDATPTITGRAEPGASVEISVDGEVVGTVTAGEDGNFELPLTEPLSDGDHVVSAVQTDEAGNVSEPGEAEFAVDTRAPAAPVITSPEDGATTDDPTPVIEGTGEPGTTIVVVVDGEPVGTVVVDKDGNFSFPLPALDDGEHTIEVIAVDEAGNESGGDGIKITVDTDGGGAGGGGGSELADTGGPGLGYLVVGGVLLAVGGTVLSVTRRRA